MHWGLPLSLSLSLSLSLLPLAAAAIVSNHDAAALDLADNEPVAGSVAVSAGSYLVAIACADCPYLDGDSREDEVPAVANGDYSLLLNLTLTPNNRSLLLNNQPVYPHLETIPTPPAIVAPQLRPETSRADLAAAASCPDPSCASDVPDVPDNCRAWCHAVLGATPLDYSYTARPTAYRGDRTTASARYWEIVVGPLGGYSGYDALPQWVFAADTEALRVVVAGTQAGRTKGNAAGDLFDTDADNKVYEYAIVQVGLVKQSRKLPSQRLSVWAKIRRFFGMDVWVVDGRLVYLREDWGSHGKHGTLRNAFGLFIHWRQWRVIGIGCGVLVGLTLSAWLVCKLVALITLQRELARWHGIDAVWSRIRADRPDDEEEVLLDDAGAYCDEPDDGAASGPSRYTDEPRSKPLPSKPLPEKPLPEVPLIDAQ